LSLQIARDALSCPWLEAQRKGGAVPDKIKRMCKLDKKTLDKCFDAVADSVREPSHICRKCAHVANRKKKLCKPEAL
jgi:hypothetical protein